MDAARAYRGCILGPVQRPRRHPAGVARPHRARRLPHGGGGPIVRVRGLAVPGGRWERLAVLYRQDDIDHLLVDFPSSQLPSYSPCA